MRRVLIITGLFLVVMSHACMKKAPSDPHVFVTPTNTPYHKLLAKIGDDVDEKRVLNTPVGLAIDSNGNIFAHNYIMSKEHTVVKFNKHGEYIDAWSYTTTVSTWDLFLAVDSSGNVYANSRRECLIAKLDNNLNLLETWEDCSQWNTEAETMKTGIHYRDGVGLLISDYGNNSIKRFSTTGQYLSGFSLIAGEAMIRGFDITTDDAGNIYMIDRDNTCIRKYDSDGNFIKKWGRLSYTSWDQDGLQVPCAIAHHGGKIAVVDYYFNYVKIFDTEGNYLSQIRAFSYDGEKPFNKTIWSPRGVAFDSEGNVYVSAGIYGEGKDRILKFSSEMFYE